MPKHYKEMMDEIINKMDEAFKVKFAKNAVQKIAVATYKNKKDAEKFRDSIIKQGGKVEELVFNSFSCFAHILSIFTLIMFFQYLLLI